MQKTFTPKQASQAKITPAPSPKTIAFIRQYARVTFETRNSLPGNSIIILN